MPPAGFEPAILASERPKTQALDRAASGIGSLSLLPLSISGELSFPGVRLRQLFFPRYVETKIFVFCKT